MNDSATNSPRSTFSRGFLSGIAAAVVAALLWQGLSAPPPAYAQIPDEGAQRERMIQELQTSNKQLVQINKTLEEIRDAQSGDAAKDAKKKRAGRP